jgi:predicted metal-dependent enzyme (double-stranded beta helix superfamily)
MNRKGVDRMITSSVPSELAEFCRSCSSGLAELQTDDAYIKFMRGELPGLLSNRSLFERILRDLLESETYPDLRVSTMFDNELLLHADPARLFSMRMFLWGPEMHTPVHDHNSWGVIGPVSGEFQVVNYRRRDDGSREEYAVLEETENLVLQPGETEFTLPLEEGIHRTGNPTRETIISISVYGRPISRGYINGFNLTNNSVFHILPPKAKKRRSPSRP